MSVVDLGAAPGGWSQVAAQRVQVTAGKGLVVAVDIVEVDAIPGVTQLTLDMTDPQAADRIKEVLGGKQADLVLSDMHAPATGHRQTDHIRIMGLVEAALDLAEDVLTPGGAFLSKVLQGGAGKDLVARLGRSFAKVRHVKPKASPRRLRRDVCARHRLPRRDAIAALTQACLFVCCPRDAGAARLGQIPTIAVSRSSP